jgi:hypothetical protein
MTNLTKLFLTVGCVLLLVAMVLRITWFPIIVSARPIHYASLLILANTSFILACLFKK